MSVGALHRNPVVRPSNSRSWVGLYPAFKQEAFTVLFLTNCWLFGKRWSYAIDLSVKIIKSILHANPYCLSYNSFISWWYDVLILSESVSLRSFVMITKQVYIAWSNAAHKHYTIILVIKQIPDNCTTLAISPLLWRINFFCDIEVPFLITDLFQWTWWFKLSRSQYVCWSCSDLPSLHALAFKQILKRVPSSKLLFHGFHTQLYVPTKNWTYVLCVVH